MGSVEATMEWQTLADLAKGAALPIEGFRAQYGGPFLLEINAEHIPLATGETRGFDLEKMRQAAEASPTAKASRILRFSGGASFCMGRGENCELRTNHETISDRHCLFEKVGPIWSVKDAGSKNGTFLNGKRLTGEEQLPLKFGTKLMLGEKQFLFLGPDDTYELLQELTKEPRIRPRSMAKYKADFKAAGTAEKIRKEFPGPFLIVQAPTSGPGDGSGPVSTNTVTLSREELSKKNDRNVADAVFDLGKHTLVRVGRATVTQIHIPLGAISNLHAAFVKDTDGVWYVQDLGAKNGTYLWGDRLEGRKALESGTEVVLGNIKTIFFSTEDFVTYCGNRDIV